VSIKKGRGKANNSAYIHLRRKRVSHYLGMRRSSVQIVELLKKDGFTADKRTVDRDIAEVKRGKEKASNQ